jgi:hypothetical protein
MLPPSRHSWLGRVRWSNTGRCPLLCCCPQGQPCGVSLLLCWFPFLVWPRHSCGCFLLLLLNLLISGLSAVGDLGQKLVDALDVFLAPDVHGSAAAGERLRLRHLPYPDVVSQSRGWKPELLSGCACGKTSHSHAMYEIDGIMSSTFFGLSAQRNGDQDCSKRLTNGWRKVI